MGVDDSSRRSPGTTAPAATGAPASAEDAAVPPAKILIVDDEPGIQRTVKRCACTQSSMRSAQFVLMDWSSLTPSAGSMMAQMADSGLATMKL